MKLRHFSTWSATALALVFVALCVRQFSAAAQSVSGCPDDLFEPKGDRLLAASTIHPNKVVARPWRGRHHVYGVFELPPTEDVSVERVFAVSIDGDGIYCGKVEPSDNIRRDPHTNNIIAVGHLRTRAALWIAAKGGLDRLKQPHNWEFPSTSQ